jgi:hypothetical protein
MKTLRLSSWPQSPALAPAAGLSLTACGSGSPAASSQSGGSPAASLAPGTATNGQICQAVIGTSGSGCTVQSATTLRNDAAVNNAVPLVDAPNTATPGDVGAGCSAVMSDGSQIDIIVTLFSNGTVGWHQ